MDIHHAPRPEDFESVFSVAQRLLGGVQPVNQHKVKTRKAELATIARKKLIAGHLKTTGCARLHFPQYSCAGGSGIDTNLVQHIQTENSLALRHADFHRAHRTMEAGGKINGFHSVNSGAQQSSNVVSRMRKQVDVDVHHPCDPSVRRHVYIAGSFRTDTAYPPASSDNTAIPSRSLPVPVKRA